MNCTPPDNNGPLVERLSRVYKVTPQLDEVALLLSIWSHPTRLRIFAVLNDAGRLCVCDLATVLNLSTPAVSQNLAKMRAQQLVSFTREKQTLYYSLVDHPINRVIRSLIEQTDGAA